MHKRIIEIMVGIFMLGGIIALVFIALRISGLSDIYHSNDGYIVTAQFDNVGGLKPKAKVTVAGVAIGRVTNIDFDNETFRATVSLQIDKGINNLPKNTSARILTAGLLGDNYIGLDPNFVEIGEDDFGSDEVEYLHQGSEIPPENTFSAVLLEELIEKFLSSTASGI